MKAFITNIPEELLVPILKYYLKNNIKTLDNISEDLTHVTLLKRNITKYRRNGLSSHKSSLNAVISLVNMFGVENTITMLKYLVEQKYHAQVKTYLCFLGFISEYDFQFLINLDYILLGELDAEGNIKRR